MTQMPIASSFRHSAIWRRIRSVSTTSRIPATTKNTPSAAFCSDWDSSERNTKLCERCCSESCPAVQRLGMEGLKMQFPNKEELARLREKYPPGTKIILHHMKDPYPVPEGTIGTVQCVDDAGNIHVKWQNGSSLSVIEGVDDFSKAPGASDNRGPTSTIPILPCNGK